MAEEELTPKQKTIFLCIMILIQAFQLAGVIAISVINHRFYEMIVMYLSMVIGKVCFKKSWHADSLLVCTLTTFVVYYFLTCGVVSVRYSISCSVIFGYFLAFILYKCAVIKEKVNSTIEIKNENGCIEIDLAKMPVEEIKQLCLNKSFSDWDTSFLIEFIKNPNGLKKYEIADKYHKDEKYMYRYAKRLINKLRS